MLKGDPAAAHVSNKVDTCIGDVTDLESLERFFRVDNNQEIVVIHCAAIVTLNPDFNQKVYDVNVTGTKNILDACIAHEVKKLVYVSSTGAIPELPHGKSIKETDHFDPDPVVGYYGKTDSIKDIVAWLEHEHKIQTV